jgi:ketosteroid isomerase-like protein
VRVNETEDTIEKLLAACRRDHAAWINGDPSGYVLPEDATLMAAMGGTGRGGLRTAQRQREGNSKWESGSGEVELVHGGVREDIAWLVMIERAQVKFAGRSQPARWELRVTELFRNTDTGWERFHRHADPLVDLHSLDEMVALLEG